MQQTAVSSLASPAPQEIPSSEAAMNPLPHSPGQRVFLQLAVLCLVGSILPAWLLLTRPPLYNTDSFWMTGHVFSPFVVPHFPPIYPLFTRSINYVTMSLFYSATGDLYPGLAYNLNDVGTYSIVIIQHGLLALALALLAMHVARTFSRRLLIMVVMSLNPSAILSCHNIMTEGLLCSLMVFQLIFAWRVWVHPKAGTWLDHAGGFLILFLIIGTRHPGVVLAGLLPGLSLLRLVFVRSRSEILRFAVSLGCGLLALYGGEKFMAYFSKTANKEAYASVWGRAGSYRVVAPKWQELPADQREAFIASVQAQLSDPGHKAAARAVIENGDAWVGTWNAARTALVANGNPAPTNAQVDSTLNAVCTAGLFTFDPAVTSGMQQDATTYLAGVRISQIIDYPFILTGVPVDHAYISKDPNLMKMCKHLMQASPDMNMAGLADIESPLLSRILRKLSPLTNAEYLLGLATLAILGGLCHRLDSKTVLFVIACLVLMVVYFVLMAVGTIYMWRYTIVGTFIYYPVLGILIGRAMLTRNDPNAAVLPDPAV